MGGEFTFRRSPHPAKYPNSIRERRIAAALTQRELADRIGCRRKLISGWERGRCLPNLTHVFRLARALDTLAEHLYWELYRPAVGIRQSSIRTTT